MLEALEALQPRAGDISGTAMPASWHRQQCRRLLHTSSAHASVSSSGSGSSGSGNSKVTNDMSKEKGGATTQGHSGGDDDDDEHDEEKDRKAMEGLSAMQKFKYMLRRYGRFAAVYYFCLGTADIALYYTLISAGLDVQPFLDAFFHFFGANPEWVSPKYGNLIAAYSVHKVMTVPRVLFIASTTPSIVKQIKIRYPNFYQKYFR